MCLVAAVLGSLWPRAVPVPTGSRDTASLPSRGDRSGGPTDHDTAGGRTSTLRRAATHTRAQHAARAGARRFARACKERLGEWGWRCGARRQLQGSRGRGPAGGSGVTAAASGQSSASGTSSSASGGGGSAATTSASTDSGGGGGGGGTVRLPGQSGRARRSGQGTWDDPSPPKSANGSATSRARRGRISPSARSECHREQKASVNEPNR